MRAARDATREDEGKEGHTRSYTHLTTHIQNLMAPVPRHLQLDLDDVPAGIVEDVAVGRLKGDGGGSGGERELHVSDGQDDARGGGGGGGRR